ncbi:hypothetical protein ACPOL_1764 [Acidisarcina polymorpha]|uniref:Uncharacterized protein n=1 Tax=Acidisarcina polymorpha TaxID=2211140 RepID=A0A2Z5FXJ6_9BACT|nr:hypothetical protein ACPOL_1764 [Acidisarcina polymorpha]
MARNFEEGTELFEIHDGYVDACVFSIVQSGIGRVTSRSRGGEEAEWSENAIRVISRGFGR